MGIAGWFCIQCRNDMVSKPISHLYKLTVSKIKYTMVSDWCCNKVKEGNSFIFQFNTTDKDITRETYRK
jgi:hypothetical protein